MSRIHEAMKKAGREGEAQTSGIGQPQTSSAGAVESATEKVVPASAIGLFAHANLSPSTFDEIGKHCSHAEWHPDPDLNVFLSASVNPIAAEQFRTLRSRLYQLRSNQPLRVMLLTSSVALEGKTFIANNLAQALVRQPECRALIIDADLRCPRLHLMLGAPAFPGLSDYLQGNVDESAIIQHGQEGNLYFIPSGTDVNNPSELLSNGRLRILLSRIASAFDWVIVDSPPCLPVADASVLADFCDGVLLVARSGATPAELVQKAVQQLQTRKTVIGVVLNAAEEVAAGYSSYDKGPRLVEPPEKPGQLEIPNLAS